MNGMDYKGLSLNRIATLANKRHPLTGELLVPLGLRKNGLPMWQIMGGSEDAGSGSTGGQGSEDDSDTDSKDKEGSGNSSEDKENEAKDKDKPPANSEAARIAALEDEKERQYTRRKEAEARADKAEQEAKELREKDLPELEKLKSEAETLRTDNVALNQALEETRLDIAFLKDNTYNWHNPGRALQAVDRSRIEIDKDGSVRGLAEALKALAESDPYLIKTEEKTSDKDKDAKDKDGKEPPKSGDQKNDKKDTTSSAEKKRAELIDRYPGLRR